MQSSLYDLSPVLHIMLMGLVLALGPLAWVWLRNRQAQPERRLAALTLLTLFLTFDLVLFGAFTRLTDSGLGCPDWPGCYGSASPHGAREEISAAQAEMPTGPVTHTKAWIEMIHRYLATGVGVLILAMTVAAWRMRRRLQASQPQPLGPWWPTVTLVWVCLQGAFGALTVTMKLQPAIVTLHLLGGMVLIALLCAQAVAHARSAEAGAADRNSVVAVSAGLRAGLLLAYAALWVQIALGAWVSTNYAVLACDTFPACQGSFWPPMDFRQGFEWWRPLGKTGAGEHIAFAALTAIHYTHRLAAYGVVVLLGWVAWCMRGGPLHAQARWIAGLLALQFLTGLSNVVLDWPLAAAVAHTGGAAALVAVLTWAVCASRGARSDVPVHPLARHREAGA